VACCGARASRIHPRRLNVNTILFPKLMSFFDRFRSSSNQSNSGGSTPGGSTPTDGASQVVRLRVNAGDEVEVPASEAQGKTIAQLFEQYADDLGIEPGRITRYVDSGTILSGTAPVTLGRTYRGAAATDEKGTN
jgi:hypothetical protein